MSGECVPLAGRPLSMAVVPLVVDGLGVSEICARRLVARNRAGLLSAVRERVADGRMVSWISGFIHSLFKGVDVGDGCNGRVSILSLSALLMRIK